MLRTYGHCSSTSSVPVQPILLASQEEPGMFDYFRKFPWVLETRRYTEANELLQNVADWVIAPAERRVAQKLT